MKIGKVQIEGILSLAPMAGYGDIAFRRLCRDYGAALTVTEMVSVKGLLYGSEKTDSLLRLAPNETPSCVQLFGYEPNDFYRALQLPCLAPFDIIDINMGCPVPKIVKNGEGSALLSNAARAADIVRACVAAGHGKPVTVKIRLGRNEGEFVALDFAEKMEKAGAAAITVHGRTAAQGYRGKADWAKIAEVVKYVSVPVIGNGDVRSLEEAEARIKETGCQMVAVGRGSLGRPTMFSERAKDPLLAVILKHIEYALLYFPERVAVQTLRKHLHHYLAGLKGGKELRLRVNACERAEELKEILTQGLAPDGE